MYVFHNDALFTFLCYYSFQLEDTKRFAEAETRDRAALLSRYRSLATDLAAIKQRIEEEAERKTEIQRQLSKTQSDIQVLKKQSLQIKNIFPKQLWKSKYENEALSRIEELEGGRTKILARLAEAEETIESLTKKIGAMEKCKSRLEAELEQVPCCHQNVMRTVFGRRGWSTSGSTLPPS